MLHRRWEVRVEHYIIDPTVTITVLLKNSGGSRGGTPPYFGKEK